MSVPPDKMSKLTELGKQLLRAFTSQNLSRRFDENAPQNLPQRLPRTNNNEEQNNSIPGARVGMYWTRRVGGESQARGMSTLAKAAMELKNTQSSIEPSITTDHKKILKEASEKEKAPGVYLCYWPPGYPMLKADEQGKATYVFHEQTTIEAMKTMTSAVTQEALEKGMKSMLSKMVPPSGTPKDENANIFQYQRAEGKPGRSQEISPGHVALEVVKSNGDKAYLSIGPNLRPLEDGQQWRTLASTALQSAPLNMSSSYDLDAQNFALYGRVPHVLPLTFLDADKVATFIETEKEAPSHSYGLLADDSNSRQANCASIVLKAIKSGDTENRLSEMGGIPISPETLYSHIANIQRPLTEQNINISKDHFKLS